MVTVDSVEEYILERAQFKLNLDGKVIQAGKFDQKSTSEEREAMLRAILEDEQAQNDEDGVYGDEELNEIIARTEEEKGLFAKIDKEAEKKLSKSRLIEESELPDVYLKEEEENTGNVTPDPASGIRSARRKDVSYNENISDDKWLASLDKETSELDTPAKKRKGSIKLTIKTEMASNRPDGLDESIRSRIIQSVIDSLDDCVDESGHRYRIDIFQELPARDLYPDYYKIIRDPISMAQIRPKKYLSIWEMQADFDLMFNNAQTYNIEGSLVYEDASVLRQLVKDQIDELLASYGRFDTDDNGNEEDSTTDAHDDDEEYYEDETFD